MTQAALTIGVLFLLLFIETGVVFFQNRYYRKKLKEQQERFAGYLSSLDNQNKRLKEKIGDISNKKLRPRQTREFEL